MESLHSLLQALQPAGMPLQQLAIESDTLQGPPLQPLLAAPHSLAGCTKLAALTSLALHKMAGEQDSGLLSTALEALMPQAPLLRTLSLNGCVSLAREFPACIMAAVGLRRLSLRGCSLTQLPAGPYLSELEQLDLSRNRFSQMPPALAGASRLRTLMYDAHRLTEADVQAVLGCLPNLTLQFASPPSPYMVACIRRGAPTVLLQVTGKN